MAYEGFEGEQKIQDGASEMAACFGNHDAIMRSCNRSERDQGLTLLKVSSRGRGGGIDVRPSQFLGTAKRAWLNKVKNDKTVDPR